MLTLSVEIRNLKNHLSKNDIDEAKLPEVMQTIIDSQITDVGTLESNREKFDEETFDTLRTMIIKDPKSFRKYMTLNDIYRSFH